MAGLLRNLMTLAWALLRGVNAKPADRVDAWFLVTPLDVGIATLKSDRYLQLAECAQLDYLVRTGLMRRMLGSRYSFVNASLRVGFERPIRVFSRVLVQTRVVHTDAKFAWFSHVFLVRGQRCAEVLVRMKFKQGRLTIPPAGVVGAIEATGEELAGLA